MPDYDFSCVKCKVYTTITCGMNDTEKRKNVKCPKCGRKMERIWATPNFIIKSTLGDVKLLPNQKIVDVDGRPVKLNFIDHGERSGIPKDSQLNQFAGARIDEKTGKPVIDVVSNIPDPLGAISKAKQKGDAEIIQKKVNQPVKTRKTKK